MGHQNNQITIKDILSKHDNMYDVLLSMQLNLFPLSSLDLVDVDNEKQYGSYYAFSIPIQIPDRLPELLRPSIWALVACSGNAGRTDTYVSGNLSGLPDASANELLRYN